MPDRRKLIVGNWKMNLLVREADRLVHAIRPQENIVVCPPFTALAAVAGMLKGSAIHLGAQDCHYEEKGAFTGDISAAMLKELGCGYAIVGHSERRIHHKETSELVCQKAEAAHRAGLTAIVCVGETAEERHEGKTRAVLDRQVSVSVPQGATAKNTVIAYEPVWAIGTGNTATAEDIADMHGFISWMIESGSWQWGGSAHPLYGGSVKASNAKEILSIVTVGGVLVGGASLDAAEFNAIAEAR